jgi:RND family efflux transporter MFP subunit
LQNGFEVEARGRRGRASRAAGLLLASLLMGTNASRAAELDCLVEPWRDVTVSAAIEGVVEEVLVDRGDRVEKNQVVARLESSVEKATVEMAKARYESKGKLRSSEAQLKFADRALQRQLSLEERDVVSQGEMDEVRSVKDIAEAELQLAREETQVARHELERTRAVLERRTIRSPVEGVVVKRILSSGEYADPPQVLRLAQIDPLRVEVFAPLAYFGKIELGMSARIRLEEPVGGEHEAKVVVVDPVIDAASGTFGVRLELPNPSYALPAGLKCWADFGVEVDPIPQPSRTGGTGLR